MKLYEQQTIVILTKHKKEQVIQPLVEAHCGGTFIIDDVFDTDSLGSFSREIKRKKNQLDTARQKIKQALKRNPASIAIVSEGSFGPHPMIPIPWNVEIVVLVDKVNHIEVIGVHESSDTNFNHRVVSSVEELQEFAKEVKFPIHGLLLRPDHESHKKIIKDITSDEKLIDAFHRCLKESKHNRVFVETDMRAHRNPTRMNNIQKATQHMVDQLLTRCPVCQCPGFVITSKVKGLPCECCGEPTQLVLKHIYSCQRCKYQEDKMYPHGVKGEARYCDWCNP